MLNLALKESTDGHASPQDSLTLSGKLLLHLRGEPVQERIRKAVQTGNALEVEAVLGKVLSDFFSHHRKTAPINDPSDLEDAEPLDSDPNPYKPR
jgi:hypothetical protein